MEVNTRVGVAATGTASIPTRHCLEPARRFNRGSSGVWVGDGGWTLTTDFLPLHGLALFL